MQYKQINVNLLLNKITKKDTLFGGDYTIDPYQNCEYGCNYCDSSFDKTIYIKSNAEEILKKELKQENNGRIIIGSVHDPYQKTEEKYKITREILKIIKENSFSCHVLTKSNLVLRDIDILSKIPNCMVTISLASIKKSIKQIFEKDAPPIDIRLKTVRNLSAVGIKTGIAVIPILPYITENEIEETVKLAKTHNVKYFLHKYLELKGNQKTLYYKILKNHFPELIEKYDLLYQNNFFPNRIYTSKITNKINSLCNYYKIKNKI
jgi:DNA repair photolyase